MKTTRTLKTSWLLLAMAAAITLGEVAAWKVSSYFQVHLSPVVVAFVAALLVAVVVSVIYEGEEVD
jgi:hypothetical protein